MRLIALQRRRVAGIANLYMDIENQILGFFENHRAYVTIQDRTVIVPDESCFVCAISEGHMMCLGIGFGEVRMSLRVLKHIHDKRVYREGRSDLFDLIIRSIPVIVADPDYVYRNKPSGTGDYVFVRECEGRLVACVVQVSVASGSSSFSLGQLTLGGADRERIEVVSAFQTEKEYFDKPKHPDNAYALLWSREDDDPSIVMPANE